MAVAQEFFDVFIRIEDVNRIYPGGFSAYLDDCADDVGYTIWHDEHLLREGAMNSGDVETIVKQWERRGLVPWRNVNDKPVEWLELCVSSELMGGPTLPCNWISFDDVTRSAYLAGTDPGPVAWPSRRGLEDDDELIPF